MPYETPSDADAAKTASDHQKLSEYTTHHDSYESQVLLLNKMQEHNEKFMHNAETSNPIELLETAAAVEDP